MVEYSYYTNTFLGQTIKDETEFLRVAKWVWAYIQKITFARADAENVAVKDAVCAVCDVYYLYQQADGIAGESNDGYSVTYMPVHLEKKLYAAAKVYLPAELLYCGV